MPFLRSREMRFVWHHTNLWFSWIDDRKLQNLDQRPERASRLIEIKDANSLDRMERGRSRVKGRNAKHARVLPYLFLTLGGFTPFQTSANAQLSQQFGRDEYEFYWEMAMQSVDTAIVTRSITRESQNLHCHEVITMVIQYSSRYLK